MIVFPDESFPSKMLNLSNIIEHYIIVVHVA